jgi:undecaprenyl diphosphate synthase
LEELVRQVDRRRLPHHVAIIMDGNGRWARQRGLPRAAGHREGAKSAREVIAQAAELGIKVLTLFAFSVENWRRPREEIDLLMDLLVNHIRKELPTLLRHKIRVRAIGAIDALPPAVRRWVRKAEEESRRGRGLLLNVALNYGGRSDILDAVRALLREVQTGKLHPEKLDEPRFASALQTAGLPDPDLLIRTSGEHRVSNFLLWQLAYTELYFTDTLWPDFRRREFLLALLDYQQRERRFGLTGEQVQGGRPA